MQSKESLRKQILNLWSNIGNVRRYQFYLLFILTIFASLSEVVSIGAVLPFLGIITAPELVFEHQLAKPIIEFFNINNPSELLLPLTIIFVCAAIISGVMRVALLWAQTRWSHSIGADISLNIYSKTLYRPYIEHLNRNSSEIISGITTKVNNVAFQVILPIVTIISSSIILVSILAMLFYIDPVIASITFFGFGFIYLIIILLSNKSLSKFSNRINKEQIQVVKALQEGLGGIRDVLLNGNQNTYIKIFRDADYPLRRAIANVHILSGAPRYGIESLGIIFIVIIAYILSSQSVGGSEVVIPVLGALAIGAQRLLPVLQQGYQSWTLLVGHKDPLYDVLKLLNQPFEIINEDKAININRVQFNKDISLENLFFNYKTESESVLKNINFKITKGDMVGIIGTTGSGKTTLIDVIMGLLTPTKGKLLIDDEKVTKENILSWQSQIAHVPQHIYLSDSSIAENIAFGINPKDIDINRVKNCAKLAELSNVIDKLEDKFDTIVGERGARLSGGQRQRIGIARALYRDAELIVLDEATSALDIETEKMIMKTIESISSNVTFLIIAHRESTLKKCNKIIKLENGKIIDIGSYQEIIGSGE